MILKEIKYNLHYDDGEGWGGVGAHKITTIGVSVWFSFFICNTVVCDAAHASPSPPPRSTNPIT